MRFHRWVGGVQLRAADIETEKKKIETSLAGMFVYFDWYLAQRNMFDNISQITHT